MRLITRKDFDGFVCAMILKKCNIIDTDILFVHTKDIEENKIHITERDILTNLPYCSNAYLCFDYHKAEVNEQSDMRNALNWIIDTDVKSSSRVVYNYYKNRGYDLTGITEDLLLVVDKYNNAEFTEDEILHPRDWVLLSFILDSKTGVNRFYDFKDSNYDLILDLIDICLDTPIHEILKHPDLQDRINLYFSQSLNIKHQLMNITKKMGDVALIDFRNEPVIYAGNRFIIYALFPEIKISIHVYPISDSDDIKVIIGKSIFDKSSEIHIGKICEKFNGGGNENAGACIIPSLNADELIYRITNYCNETEQINPTYVLSEEKVIQDMHKFACKALLYEKDENHLSESEYQQYLTNFNSYYHKYVRNNSYI